MFVFRFQLFLFYILFVIFIFQFLLIVFCFSFIAFPIRAFFIFRFLFFVLIFIFFLSIFRLSFFTFRFFFLYFSFFFFLHCRSAPGELCSPALVLTIFFLLAMYHSNYSEQDNLLKYFQYAFVSFFVRKTFQKAFNAAIYRFSGGSSKKRFFNFFDERKPFSSSRLSIVVS